MGPIRSLRGHYITERESSPTCRGADLTRIEALDEIIDQDDARPPLLPPDVGILPGQIDRRSSAPVPLAGAGAGGHPHARGDILLTLPLERPPGGSPGIRPLGRAQCCPSPSADYHRPPSASQPGSPGGSRSEYCNTRISVRHSAEGRPANRVRRRRTPGGNSTRARPRREAEQALTAKC